MRSAGVDEGDRTARARIRDAAIARFAADGFGAPVRVIAADARVSPGLLNHHFGSKDGLRTACDEHVLRRVHETRDGSPTSPADLLAGLGLQEESVPLVGYLVQALLAGGDLATRLLTRLTEDTEQYLADAVAAGRVRPSRDPAARAAHLVDTGVGALLAFIRRHPPADGDLRPVLQDYAATRSLPVLELHTEGLLTDATLLREWLQRARDDGGRR